MDGVISQIALNMGILRGQENEWHIGPPKTNSRCPKCQSEEIEGGSFDSSGSEAWQKVGCVDCDATWREVYEFSRHENLKAPEKAV